MQTKQTGLTQRPATEQLSDAELWKQARLAKSMHAAAIQLSQFNNVHLLKERAAEVIHKLLSDEQPELSRWPFLRGVLQVYGSHISSGEELALLKRVASDLRQPITLRETAFRS